MRYSIFSVNDHHPRLARSVPQLYSQVMRQCELAESLVALALDIAQQVVRQHIAHDPAALVKCKSA